jgi:predicted DsbA family dithiol-disulfide isomerase
MECAVTEPIRVDIWSDVACPWCYIGKRNFETGVSEYRESEAPLTVEVEYHSFVLAPEAAVEFEGSHTDYLASRKGISPEQVEVMDERVTGIARSVGLEYDFAAQQPTNTVRAHQLLHFAKAHGKQAEMKERLLRAHFVDGEHVGRVEDLADLAAEIGLDRDLVVRSLEDDEYLPDVEADLQKAREYGINGVPFFVIDGKYGLSGAQPPEAFVQALSHVTAERREAS